MFRSTLATLLLNPATPLLLFHFSYLLSAFGSQRPVPTTFNFPVVAYRARSKLLLLESAAARCFLWEALALQPLWAVPFTALTLLVLPLPPVSYNYST